MIFRNSIKSIIRSKGKTALFTLLILATTLALALSVSVWASVAQFLDDCDDFYTTIGLVEYMGTNYPDDTVYDDMMNEALRAFDIAMIKDDTSSLMWETPSRSFGYINGFWRTDTHMPDRMLSVFVIGNVTYSEENNFYKGVVYNTLYSSLIEDNKIIYIDENFGEFEQGRFYLVFGEVYHGYSPILHLGIASFDNTIVMTDEVVVPRLVDITSSGTDSQFYAIPENSVLRQVADTLAVTNNSVLVSSTNNLMAMLPFHQEELYIIDGRTFTTEEYSRGSHVAVISELMAARLGIGVGDTFDLSVAVSDLPGIYNSYWVADGFSYDANFKVVGITNTVMDKSWYVYVPKSTGVPSSPFPIGYTVGHVVLENDEAAEFYLRVDPLITDRFQIKIFDQGYSAVALPYQTILSTAKIVTVVCAFVELAVVTLFGFLFVYRQHETSETMLMLGAGKARVFSYFIISAGFISLLAAGSGAVTGYWLHDRIIALVARTAENFTLIDSRYSNGNLTISRTLEFAPNLSWQLFLYVGAVVFLLTILACIVFTHNTFPKKRRNQRKPRGPRTERRTSHLRGGSLKYALLSILRGQSRTFVVPILAITVVIFFGHLTTTSLQYKEQLETIHNNTKIVGYYTDINGKQMGNLVLNAYDVANLNHSGHLSTLAVSIGEPYYFIGISKLADGSAPEISPLYVPTNSFRRESLETVILRGPDLTATNDIRKSPEFYYADSITLAFLANYDESILAVPSGSADVFSCIIPTSLMTKHGIGLGDTIRIAINNIIRNPIDDQRIYLHYDLRVVGSYEKQGTEETIYTPLSLYFDTELVWGSSHPALGTQSEEDQTIQQFTAEETETLQSTVFHSTNFTLKDSRGLISFKDYLGDYGYSEVHNVSKVREFIVLRDASFNNAIASIKQQNHYINILYPLLYGLVGIIAVTVSYLLVVSRKNEFATMRGLGATRLHSFFSFFFEQSILCLIGTSMGLTIWWSIWGISNAQHVQLTFGFLVSYYLGCAISIIIMNHTQVLTILLDRD